MADPFKSQFKDEALGQKFFDTADLRNKIYNIRRRLFKAGECPNQQGTINVHGDPMKPSRPGSTTLKKLDILSTQLSEEYNHLSELESDKRTEKTYKGFLRVVEKWEKQLEEAHPWLSDEERVELPKGLEEIKSHIGYTEFIDFANTNAADVSDGVTSDDTAPDPKADDTPTVEEPETAPTISEDGEAVSEAAKVAENVQAEMGVANETPAEAPAPTAEATENADGSVTTPKQSALKQLMKDARSLQARLIVSNFDPESINAVISEIAEELKKNGIDS